MGGNWATVQFPPLFRARERTARYPSAGASSIGRLIAAAIGLISVPLFGSLSARVGRRPLYHFGSVFLLLFSWASPSSRAAARRVFGRADMLVARRAEGESLLHGAVYWFPDGASGKDHARDRRFFEAKEGHE